MRAPAISILALLVVGAVACGEGPGTPGGTGGEASGGAASGGTVGSATGGSSTGGGSGGSPAPLLPPNWTVSGITTWRGDAHAAYTIIHDDTCQLDNQFSLAAPALEARGLRASFGAIADSCDEQWDELAALVTAGHEVMSHSWSHQNLADVTFEEAVAEIDDAKTALEEHLGPGSIEFFIFPFDSFDDALIEHLRGAGYVGTRAGVRGFNEGDFGDDFRLDFDVFGPGYSIYAGAEGTACASVQGGDDWNQASSSCRVFILDKYVDDVIAAGGYGIRELHSVADQGWEPVPIAEYEQHLDHVEAQVEAGALWVDTASTVIRYRRARDACGVPTSSGDELVFDDVSADCSRYATVLTFRIAPLAGSVLGLSATQAGEPVPVRQETGGTFLVDADPSLGPVVLEAL